MVVKVEKSSPKANRANNDKLTKVSVATSDSYIKLKKIVPAISEKENISKLDVVLEAISYIQRLKDDLETNVTPVAAPLVMPVTSLVTSGEAVTSPTMVKHISPNPRQC